MGEFKGAAEPDYNCDRCPRLVSFRSQLRLEHIAWFNGPVPTFGSPDGELLIVGLAPGMHGANRTGRPFTGDYAGDLLYATLGKFGWSNDKYASSADDDLELNNCAITNAVRCLPPKNKPTGPEATECREFLEATIEAMPNLKVIMALGKIAHDNVVRISGERLKEYKFGHGAKYTLEIEDRTITYISSYHCSRYNTNTRRLTPEMFDNIFKLIEEEISPS